MVLVVSLILLLFMVFLVSGLVITEPLLLGLLVAVLAARYIVRGFGIWEMEKEYQRRKKETPVPVEKKSYLHMSNPLVKASRTETSTDVYVSGLGLHYYKERS